MERSSEELYQMKDLKYAAESGNKKVILGKKKKKKKGWLLEGYFLLGQSNSGLLPA